MLVEKTNYMNEILKDNNGAILDPKIPRYEKIKYNLVTDGKAVKTGRKIDGRNEWVKRVNIGTLPNSKDKIINAGLDFAKISLTSPITGFRTFGEAVTNLPDASPNGFTRFYISINKQLIIATNYDSSDWTGCIDIYFVCIDDNYNPNS